MDQTTTYFVNNSVLRLFFYKEDTVFTYDTIKFVTISRNTDDIRMINTLKHVIYAI